MQQKRRQIINKNVMAQKKMAEPEDVCQKKMAALSKIKVSQ